MDILQKIIQQNKHLTQSVILSCRFRDKVRDKVTV